MLAGMWNNQNSHKIAGRTIIQPSEQFKIKLNICLPNKSAISLLSTEPKETKASPQRGGQECPQQAYEEPANTREPMLRLAAEL